ncbi:unnamed protein product [Acanthosepion pharaonis]|uniref:Uncharacterized protein n=1 Tax=Acanthosepion pharaonis TaxID=158019 RepID=A0A812CZV9_ACAPH|nr:unnamed protein product [Sepia pharaonis]
MFLASVFPKESVLVRMLMFSHSVDIEFSVGVVGFAVVSFFIGSGQLGDFWILAFFCQVFRQEFRHLRNKWLVSRTNSSNDTGNNWYKDIDTFRKEYEQVVRLVNAVERTFRFDLLLYFGVIIPVTCVFIYATLQPQDIAEADLVVIQIMACVTAVECCFIIFVGVKINSAAHELKEDLYNVDMTNMSSDVISKLSIFLTRLTASPIGISVAGLFIIDNSTILMLAGTLLTYVVVVIQTKPTSNKFRLPVPERNCTFI